MNIAMKVYSGIVVYRVFINIFNKMRVSEQLAGSTGIRMSMDFIYAKHHIVNHVLALSLDGISAENDTYTPTNHS